MANPKQKPLCCLTIGYTHLLMDADKGMQALKLLSGAIECDQDYDAGGYAYVLRAAPALEVRMVDPNRVRKSESLRRSQLALERGGE